MFLNDLSGIYLISRKKVNGMKMYEDKGDSVANEALAASSWHTKRFRDVAVLGL